MIEAHVDDELKPYFRNLFANWAVFDREKT